LSLTALGLSAQFLLIFTRRLSKSPGLLFSASIFIHLALVLTVFNLLPYLADRLINAGNLQFLIFPLTRVCADLVMIHIPFLNGFSMAYSQYQNLPLLQIPSITGALGITLILGLNESL